MNDLSKQCRMVWMCMLVVAPGLAGAGAPAAAADRYATRCKSRSVSRVDPQGTMLWGTWSGWTDKDQRRADERKSVLVSANLGSPVKGPEGVGALQLRDGQLEAGGKDVRGVVLQGTTSDGQPVEVAICEVEVDPSNPALVRYQIEAWNSVAQDWDNPCVPQGKTSPKAFAVGGVWDGSGARHDVAGKVTFACENGAIAKCIAWGYQPWAVRDGRSLADAHQACTRMVRADYCGDGQPHTQQGTVIEYYDVFGVSARETKVTPPSASSQGWDPARSSFEAAWAPDGATCINQTRHGTPLAAILKSCPGRFKETAADLGQGDRCGVQRADAKAPAPVVRNRINGGKPGGGR